jgi:hypothetical protein
MDAIHEIDPLLCSSTRFRTIAQVIADGGVAAFVDIERKLIQNPGTLSFHNRALAREGYIRINKRIVGSKVETSLQITDKGRKAFARHCAAMQAVANVELDTA